MNKLHWKEVIEEGKVFYISDVGNIEKRQDGTYVSYMPKIIVLGPFPTLGEAKQALELNKAAVDNLIEDFNKSLINLTRGVGR